MISVEPGAASSRDPRSPLPAATTAATEQHETPRDDCGWRSSKIKPRHLERQADVYLRQSTPHQMAEIVSRLLGNMRCGASPPGSVGRRRESCRLTKTSG